jgi:hypothetical protein
MGRHARASADRAERTADHGHRLWLWRPVKIRPARLGDLFAIVDLLVEKQAQSIYAGHVEVDRPVARKTLATFIQRHGGMHSGGTCLFVVEDAKGVVRGFCAGMLDRVYLVGDKLVAQDVFLVAGKGTPANTASRLIDAYLGWAMSVPEVFEINLSLTDALPQGPRVEKLYRARGFEPCGAIYRRTFAHEIKDMAA